MAEPSDKLARYQGCANWHTWHVIRIVADVDLIDVVRHCTPEELFDPEINRREGKRLLAYWYRQSKHDWAYALAAYNCGWNGLKGKCGMSYAKKGVAHCAVPAAPMP